MSETTLHHSYDLHELPDMDAQYGTSGKVPSWAGQYPPGIIPVERDGFTVTDQFRREQIDLHQAILSMSMGWANPQVEAAIRGYREQFPGVDMVDTTQLSPAATYLKKDLVEACKPYGNFRALLASSGNLANEQAIRLCMGALGGPEATQLIVMESGYGGAALNMNALCDAPGWKGQTSLPQPALVLKRDGSNIDEVFAQIPEGKRPVLHTEDGQQGVGGFVALTPEIMKEMVYRTHKKGGLVILDNVQTFARNGAGLIGYDRWTDGENDKNNRSFKPDAITFAKGLGNGRPVAAALVSEAVLDAVRESGSPGSTFDTFSQNTDGVVAAREVLSMVKNNKLWKNAQAMGGKFKENLRDLQSQGAVEDVYGEGALIAVRLASAEKVLAAMRAAPEHGIVFAKGGRGDVMRLPLPFNATEKLVAGASQRIHDVINSIRS